MKLALLLIWPPLLAMLACLTFHAIQEIAYPSGPPHFSLRDQQLLASAAYLPFGLILGAQTLCAIKIQTGRKWARKALIIMFALGMVLNLPFILRFYFWLIYYGEIYPFATYFSFSYFFPSCIIYCLLCKKSNHWFDAMAAVKSVHQYGPHFHISSPELAPI